MTTRKSIFCLALPAFVCGVMLGYLARPSKPPERLKAPQERPVRQGGRQPTDEVVRLRARVKDLEARLAAALAKPPASDETAPAARDEKPRNPFLRNDSFRMPTAAEMRANMEELRKVDPERYAQMTNRFARWHEHQLQRVEDRLGILASVDVSRLSDKERQTHEMLQDAIVRREELRELLNPQNAEMTEEQRKQAFEELRQIDHRLRELETSERNTLLTQTVRSFGLSKSDTKEMVETVKAIYKATGSGGRHGGFGGPPPDSRLPNGPRTP